ncbi:MAG: hypothetical protein EXR99_08225 [Gemmataceae bacterium]|nr:hypothetical protein [Gemmataceae bacterium]
MSMTCPKCARVNPPEAVYCYFDGFVIAGNSAGNGPLAINSQRFPSPFVFPSGKSCQNFDDLAIACHEDSKSAMELLQLGYLESFLGGIGRIDLAQAAKSASKYPNPQRALDDFLGKLPSGALSEARLNLSTQEINLGLVDRANPRKIKVEIENGGMRLLHGSITSDSLWLVIGDSGNSSVKNFQITGALQVPLSIAVDKLRASEKPLVAKVTINSSGGKEVIQVRAEVPVLPYPDGPLAKATSPRQIAEKAKQNPQGAAPFFENGAVARWYERNGWTFPVQGPSASGLGAIQQFFEALGLTPAPKCFINKTQVDLQGDPGGELEFELTVNTEEKKPVYAHGLADQPWIVAKTPKISGRMVVLGFVIPKIPDRPGELLTSRLAIGANGNQKFLVTVQVQVSGTYLPPKHEPSPELVFNQSPPPLGQGTLASPIPQEPMAPTSLKKKASSQQYSLPWVHAIPAVFLAGVILSLAVFDAFKGGGVPANHGGTGGSETKGASFGYSFDSSKKYPLRLDFNHKERNRNFRFGLFTPDKPDPKDKNRYMRLTFEEDGDSNNTRIRIDDFDFLYAQKSNARVVDPECKEDKVRHAWKTAVDYSIGDDKVRVTQLVQIVPGSQSEALDTCLVRYTIENRGKKKHKIGLRFMLDTFIGGEDGVPFVVPGTPGLLNKAKDFPQKEIPDYIQALENPDLNNPGTTVHLVFGGLALPDCEPEPLVRLVVGEHPENKDFGYDLDFAELFKKEKGPSDRFKDSAVFLYWNERDTNPGEVRDFAFSYGLSEISKPEGSAGGKLSLSAGGNLNAGKTFSLTALVKDAAKGQAVELTLPEGLSLSSGESKEKKILDVDPKTLMSQVSWKVTAAKAGKYQVKIEMGQFATSGKIQIRDSSTSLFR